MELGSKWGAVAGAVLLGLLSAAFYFGKHVAYQEAASAPAKIDTVVREVVVPRVEVRIDTLRTTRIDTVYVKPEEKWYSVSRDTLVGNTRVEVTYLSPLPLDPKGFFRINVVIPDTLVRVETITVTKFVVETEVPWEYVIPGTLAAFLLGVIAF